MVLGFGYWLYTLLKSELFSKLIRFRFRIGIYDKDLGQGFKVRIEVKGKAFEGKMNGF